MGNNKKTVEKYIDGFNKLDHEQISSCLTDDVEWVVPGFFHSHGKEEFENMIENDMFEGCPRITITRLTEENDVVVAEGQVKHKRKDGGELNALFCDVLVMQDAKIKQLTSYLAEIKHDY